jgi:hypothetical protein
MVKTKKNINKHTIAGINNEVALLLIVIVAIIVILFFNRTKCTKESFITEYINEGFKNDNDNEQNVYVASKNINVEGNNVVLTIGNETQTIPLSNFQKGDIININDYYEKGSTVESETIKLLKKKLETTQNDYNKFRQTILDSKTYQLKDSIPKIECPPCINPKVNIDAALCKKWPPIPEPQECDTDNNKSKPACVNKYTVITRNMYEPSKNKNSSNNLVEEEENQTKANYNNKMKQITNNNNNNTNNNKTNNNKTNNNKTNNNNTNNNNTNNNNTNNNNTNNNNTNNNNTNNIVNDEDKSFNKLVNNNQYNINDNNMRVNTSNQNNINASKNIMKQPEKQFGELNHSFKLSADPIKGYTF